MKKVLIITYFWPPAGGPGIQRVLKFVKYLPHYHWQPIILTVSKGEYPAFDHSLEPQIPQNCRIYKTGSVQPFRIFKKLTGRKKTDNISTYVVTNNENNSVIEKILKWIRLNIFIPDAKIGWLPFAVRAGRRILNDEKIDLIFSTGPPHTVHLIAERLSSSGGIHWVADFRDPWLEMAVYQNQKRTEFTKFLDSRLEKRILRKAHKITTISDGIAELFKSKYNTDKYEVIPNGFDPEDFRGLNAGRSDIFTIVYTGVLSEERIPYPFISAIKRLKNESVIIKVIIVGKACNLFVNIIDDNNLSEYFEIRPYVPHREALQVLMGADAALLVIDDIPQNKGFLTGKIFDYLGCRKPIVGFGPLNGDAAEILKHTNSGIMLAYDDSDGAYNVLSNIYHDKRISKNRYAFDVERYTRRSLTKKLAGIFDSIGSTL